MSAPLKLLYIAPWLPKLSETFVYKEVLGLRKAGVKVATASVHTPSDRWDEDELQGLAREAIPVYGLGHLKMLADAFLESLQHPMRSSSTVTLGVRDATLGKNLTTFGRLKIIWQTLASLALARRLRPDLPEHIHAHMAHVATTIAMYTAHQINRGFSFSGHAADIFRDRSLLEEKLQRADFVRCISGWHRHYYQSIVPRHDQEYPIVRCGVVVKPLLKVDKDNDDHAPLLLAVGRLVPKKGFDLLLRALATIRQEGQMCRCQIVGDGPEMGSLKDLSSELNLDDIVEFKGEMGNPAILEAMTKADLFVLPCRTDKSGDKDGIPVVLMEAMASGVCVVSGDLETIRELVTDQVNGRLSPPDDVPALAQSLLELLKDGSMRERLALRGHDRVQEEFSLSLNIERIHGAFMRLSTKAQTA